MRHAAHTEAAALLKEQNNRMIFLWEINHLFFHYGVNLGSFRGQCGDPFVVGDHYGVNLGIISGSGSGLFNFMT